MEILNNCRSLPKYLPSLNTIVNTGVNTGKVIGIAIPILFAASTAYAHPIYYSLGTLGLIGGSSFAISKTFTYQESPEKLRAILVVSLIAMGVGLMGGAFGLGYISLRAVVATVLERDLKYFLFYSGIFTALLGYGATAGKEILLRANKLITSSEIISNWKKWGDKDVDIARLDFYDKMILALLLCFPDLYDFIKNEVSYPVNNAFCQIYPRSYEESIAALDLLCSLGSQMDIEHYFMTHWTSIITQFNDIKDLKAKHEKFQDLSDHIIKWWDRLNIYERVPIQKFVSGHRKEFFSQLNFEFENATTRYETFKQDILKRDLDSKISDEDLNKFKKELKEAKEELNKRTTILNTLLIFHNKNIALEYRYLKLSKLQSTFKAYLEEFSLQTSEKKTVLDRIQLWSSKAKPDTQEIDLTDPVWNYFVMESIANLEDMKAWTGITEAIDLDGAFDKLGIGTLQNLVNNKIVTEDIFRHKDMKEAEAHKAEIRKKVKSYIEAKKSPDVRSVIYNTLAGVAKVQDVSKLFSRVDSVAARISYRAMMIFCTLAPMIVHPEQAIVGLAFGAAYPLVDALAGHRISNFITARNVNDIDSLFSRRQLFYLNQRSQEDLNTFVNGSLMGRIRLISFESFMGYLMASVTADTFSDIKDLDSPAIGGLIQGFMTGKDFSMLVIEKLSRLLPRRHPAI